MQYFKHPELAEKYHVSLKTIHNWIDAAKQGKLNLKLYELNNRTYIIDSQENLFVLNGLAKKGKKYRNTLHHKIATPTSEFYNLYNRKQILDIISNLTIHKEIPRQYNYFDEGAVNWEKYADKLLEENTPNLLKSSIELIKSNFGAIDNLIEGFDKINIIDIGPGNGLPVRGLLDHLLSKNVLHRYIAIDISEEMLHIVQRNIKHWFGAKVSFEGYVRDITYERFDDLLVDDMLDKNADKTLNLVLFLGATPMNFQAPYDLLKVIYNSMGPDDLLIYSDKPDNEAAEQPDLTVNAYSASALSPKYSFIFGLLNIDESTYDVEMGFNTEKRVRYIRVRLKVGLTIKFKFENGEREVHFNKGDTILLWRALYQTALEIISEFEKTGFILLQSSLTKDREYFLSISGVETKKGIEP